VTPAGYALGRRWSQATRQRPAPATERTHNRQRGPGPAAPGAIALTFRPGFGRVQPMTVTTATAPAPAGWVLPIDQLAWDRSDWLDAYREYVSDTFASSVIRASDDACQLAMADLHRLLKQHGATVAELQAELTAGQLQGAAVLPLTHAAQALTWLGY